MERGYGDLNYNVSLTMRHNNGDGKWVSVHGVKVNKNLWRTSFVEQI